MADDTWRYAEPDGKQRALSLDDLQRSLAKGLLPTNVPVWRAGFADWTPASDVPELRGSVSSGARIIPPKGAQRPGRPVAQRGGAAATGEEPLSPAQLLTSSAGLTTLALTAAISIAMCLVLFHRGQAQELQRAMVQSQRDAAEARLKLLEAQLEPHMVFNTLANLRVLIASDAPRAEAMLDHFIAYLRATLDGARAPQHALRTEYARLADYLELMAVRMGARLRYRLDLPEALAGAAVPALLLQPLVENAIRHGLEPQIAGGEIVVRARATQDGRQLHLEVLDDGAGLGTTPPVSADMTQPRHFGLEQVRERLLTLYGSQAGLTLQARAEGGTRCSVLLPLQTGSAP